MLCFCKQVLLVSSHSFSVRVRLAHLRSAARECILHVDSRNGIIGVLRVLVMFKLKARFVDDRLIDDCCFGELNTVLGLLGVVRA